MIAAGATWPDGLTLREKAKADGSFWSFRPLSRPVPPAIADAPEAWRHNPVDRFVFARLREGEAGTEPAQSHAPSFTGQL